MYCTIQGYDRKVSPVRTYMFWATRMLVDTYYNIFSIVLKYWTVLDLFGWVWLKPFKQLKGRGLSHETHLAELGVLAIWRMYFRHSIHSKILLSLCVSIFHRLFVTCQHGWIVRMMTGSWRETGVVTMTMEHHPLIGWDQRRSWLSSIEPNGLLATGNVGSSLEYKHLVSAPFTVFKDLCSLGY